MQKPSTLKLALVNRGLKQVDVAEALGIPVSRFNLIVNGRADPTAEQRRAIAKYFGRAQKDFFGPREGAGA